MSWLPRLFGAIFQAIGNWIKQKPAPVAAVLASTIAVALAGMFLLAIDELMQTMSTAGQNNATLLQIGQIGNDALIISAYLALLYILLEATLWIASIFRVSRARNRRDT